MQGVGVWGGGGLGKEKENTQVKPELERLCFVLIQLY